MKKLILFIKYNWGTILAFTIGFAILSAAISFLTMGASNFLSLENFSRRQLSAQMGLFLFIGIMQACIMVPLYLFGYYYMFMGGGMAKNLGAESSQRVKTDINWDDIIGLEEAKRDAIEIVNFLKDRRKLRVIGGTNIKGALMIGPPGCGKTYLAKAIASEAKLPFLSAVGSEFVGMIVGLGAARMKSLFKKARKLAAMEGGCIIFIDEIDSFARPRDDKFGLGGGSHNNATINQFLTEMDGLRKKDSGIIILAATNVPEEKLDPAIMRSGRFDRKITFTKPNAKEREKLIKFYLDKMLTTGNIDIPLIAEKAQWFSPSDINNMVREAGVIALRNQREQVTQDDLLAGLQKVMQSIERTGEEKILSSKTNIKWDDVIGMSDVKEEAWEIVKLLRDRSMLKAIGGKIVKGVVMFGPPGCGKTYLAKAMATEAGYPFISRAGSEFVGMFVGEGTKKMQLLFKEAREIAKAEGGCIIFFDEIDAFATPRTQDRGFGGQLSHNSTINQFLTELDGLRQAENNIVILAATNMKEGDLDPAIMRAGRLERKIHVTPPNLTDRKEIFKFYLSKVSVEESVNPEVLARTTVGFTPSEIDNMIREAGLIAMRDNRTTINQKDLSEAYDRITMGAVSKEEYSQKSIKATAYHEAGHAIMTYLAHPTDEVIKATIRPRRGTLGYIYNRAIEKLQNSAPNKPHLVALIKIVLAGYAAERIVFNETSSGVSNDFGKATNIARQMAWSFGMGKSNLIGNFAAGDPALVSEKTKEILDNDVQDILQDCLRETIEVLTRQRSLLDEFAQTLIEKGDLEYDEISAIFDKYGLKPAYEDSLEN